MARAQILVADSNPGFAVELAANLKSLGYAVTGVVSSPEEALKKAQEKRPDLVLLDLKLLADGQEGKAAGQLRKRLHNLVYLVEEADRQTLQRARITHSFDYLRKAYDSRELETIIEMALYRRKLEGEITRGKETPGKPDAGMKAAASALQSEIHRHQSLEEALQAERQKLYHLLDTLPSYIVLLAPDYSVPFANREFIKRFGAPEGRKCYEFLFGRTSPCPDCETYKVLQTNAPLEWEWTGPDGCNYQIYDFPFPDTDGSPLILEMGVDVTVLKEKEAQIQRANRALRTLSSVNQAVVRAHTEAELLEDVCRVVAAEGGYRLAWIGYAENDRAKTVRPLAQAGYEEGYLETLKMTWADQKRGRGPTGTAIRTGQPTLARNILTDPHFAPWRRQASKRGYASSLALPLLANGVAFGALNIYAGEADAFDTAEVQLLSDLAGDVSFGIMALRGREERRQMAAALRRSYEELEARVQDRTQELAQSNAALQTEIAERLWSEKRLRESEERYRRLVDLSPDAIAVQSQSRYLFINPAGAQLFGAASPQEMVGKAVPDMIHPDFRQFVTEHICRINAEGAKTDLQEIKILRLDGRVVDVEASGVGINYQGQPAVQVMMRDITRRKEMERRLEHQASFPRLNPNPVLEADLSGNITYANAATFSALRKQGLENQTNAFLPQDLDEIVKTATKTGETIFSREVEINGAYFVETVSFPKEFGTIRIYARDITQQKRAELERQETLDKLQVSEEELQATVEELQAQTEELQSQSEELLATNQQLHEALAALRESREDLNRAQAVAHTGSWRLDVRKNELLWSDETFRIFGIKQGTPLSYESFLAAVHPEDREYVDRQWLAALRGEPYDIEHRIIAGDTMKWVRERAELEFDHQEQLMGGFGTVQDITERKEADTTLQASRDFLEIANRHTEMAPLLQDYVTAIKEHTGCEAVAIRILDEGGRIPYEAYEGFPPEFIACESLLSLDSDRCLCINVCKGAVAQDLPYYTPGSSCYINSLSHLLATASPGLLGETRNVCLRFGYESVALIPIVFGGSILGLIHLADRRENMAPLSLVARLERIGLQLGTAINRVRAEEAWRRALAESRRRQAEISALLQATRAVLEAGTFLELSRSIYGSCKELIGASSGYIALLTADGQENEVLFLDPGGQACQVDPSLPMPVRGLRAEACRTGRTVYHNDFSGSDYAQLLPPGHVGLDNVLFAPLVVKGKVVGLLGLGNKPGGYTANDARLVAGFGELAAMALVNNRAEEERERLIQELETERARLQAIIASAPEAIVVADAGGRMVMANPAAERLYYQPFEEGEGLEGCALFQLCHGDGSTCVPGNQPLLRSATAGETHRNLEMILTWPDGQRRDLLVNTAPLKDHLGRSSGAVGLFQDITQRKQVEEKIRNLNAELGDRIREVSERTLQLEAANKELEAFSYSVSHDLRSPLRAIEGFARILLEEHGAELAEEALRLLNVIRSNTLIMGELIDDLLALSRLGRQEIKAQKIDPGGLVTSVFGELRAQAPERQMQLILNPLPPIYGDRSLINQVLVNLLGNAVKFTESREKTIIEVGGWTEGKEDIYFVKDNGVGFDMRYVDKIFGVFQRLHRREDFDGTGVGLAIVQRIINRHGGRVWATGKVDRGATFYFALPHKGEDSDK
ncbi:MAG: PAS domain S-box protein [Thermodesulfobacteriota bacterium]